MRRNSITPSRAFLTMGELVFTTGGCAFGSGAQVAHLHRAGGGGLRRAAHDLDKAHPAVAGDRQPLVVAEARDLDPRDLGRLDQRHGRIDLDLLPVDDDLPHVSHLSRFPSHTRPGGP